jgi:hypothetical protein
MTGGHGEVSRSRPAHPTARHRHEQQLSRPLRRAYDRRQPHPSSIRNDRGDIPRAGELHQSRDSSPDVSPVRRRRMRLRKCCCKLLTTVSKETTRDSRRPPSRLSTSKPRSSMDIAAAVGAERLQLHRRRDHGGVRRANRVGGSRFPRLPGGVGHSGGGEAACDRRPTARRCRPPVAGGAELRS